MAPRRELGGSAGRDPSVHASLALAAPRQHWSLALSLSSATTCGCSRENLLPYSPVPAHLSPRGWLPPGSLPRAWHHRPSSPIFQVPHRGLCTHCSLHLGHAAPRSISGGLSWLPHPQFEEGASPTHPQHALSYAFPCVFSCYFSPASSQPPRGLTRAGALLCSSLYPPLLGRTWYREAPAWPALPGNRGDP